MQPKGVHTDERNRSSFARRALLEGEMLRQSKRRFCRSWWLMPLSLLRRGGDTERS